MPKAVHRSGCRDKHNWLQPLTPQSIMPSLDHCDLLRHVGVSSLPKVVTRQRRGRELNSQPASSKSNALATRPSSHPKICLHLALIFNYTDGSNSLPRFFSAGATTGVFNGSSSSTALVVCVSCPTVRVSHLFSSLTRSSPSATRLLHHTTSHMHHFNFSRLSEPAPKVNPWGYMARHFSHTRCPSCCPTNNVKALEGYRETTHTHHNRFMALFRGPPR